MTYEEKLQKIVSRLKEERDLSRKGHKTEVVFDDVSFTKIRIREICKILLKLQDDEHAIKIVDAFQPIETVPTEKLTAPPSDDDDYAGVEIIMVELDEIFDEWYKKYLLEQEAVKPSTESLEGYSSSAYEKLWSILEEIEEKRIITSSKEPIKIRTHFDVTGAGLVSNHETRRTILDKLVSLGAIKSLREVNFNHWYFQFYIDTRYKEIFEEVESKYKHKPIETSVEKDIVKPVAQNDSVIYEIKYSEKTRMILLNNLLLKQPRSFGNNEAIFAYLYKNPNQDKSIEDIKSGTRLDSIKDLNKFVENIGFTGDLRKVFFKVSKNTIRFNNPVTKDDLRELNIDYLKLE